MNTLEQLLAKMRAMGATRYLAKRLAPNDNSKNQLYVGPSSQVFSVLPPQRVVPTANTAGQPAFKAPLDFHWLSETGELRHAPRAQLIYYPQYPEVRLGSLLQGAGAAPSALIKSRDPGRVLVLGVANDKRVIGFICRAPHPIAQEILAIERAPDEGVFHTLEVEAPDVLPEQSLYSELCRIAQAGWLPGKRLTRENRIVPCNSSNCAGYTLEAELGISPNGYSEPDYLGWEVKTFTVRDFGRNERTVLTLMTPEPSGGVYADSGVISFMRTYGCSDVRGRVDRLNFTGPFRVGLQHSRTGLTMVLNGVDDTGALTRADGEMALVDREENVAASWRFDALLEHWNRKHSKAAFVPNVLQKEAEGERRYCFDRNVRQGIGTDFSLLLKALLVGRVYYDPGIKLDRASTPRPVLKRRSQFRTSSAHLGDLYHSWSTIDACSYGCTHA